MYNKSAWVVHLQMFVVLFDGKNDNRPVLPAIRNPAVRFLPGYDDDAIIYINGIKVVDTGNACKKNERVKLSEEVVASLKPGENLIAGYCHKKYS